jgi:hypothetical protein
MQRSRLWIPITLSALSLFGCGQREPIVWVDLDRVESAFTHGGTPREIPFGQEDIAPASIHLEPIQPSNRGRENVGERRAEAMSLLQSESATIIAELQAAYEKEIGASAKSAAQSLLESFAKRTEERFTAVETTISDLIISSSAQRGRAAARLALLCGWPDSGKLVVPKIAVTSRVEEQMDAEARRLRQDIAEMDAACDSRISAILLAAKAISEGDAANLQRRTTEILAGVRSRAMAKAEARARETGRLEIPKLLRVDAGALRGQSDFTIELPGIKGAVIKRPIEQPMGVTRGLLNARLNIWLSLHGYKLSPGPKGAADKTGDFIAWINRL